MNAQKIKTEKNIIPKTMKAAVCTRYGSPDFLVVKDVPVPVLKETEVLVKVHATTVTKADTMMRQADPFISRFFLGLTKPKNDITGTGFAGEVVKIGQQVTKFKVGDHVFGMSGINFGANAEYVRVSEDGVIMEKPESISFEEAATITDGFTTSWNFLKKIGNIQAGQKVLINGASGSLGTAAIQIAKAFGVEVTGVCSTKNISLVKFLGADYVIDYTKTDFAQTGMKYDLIYDAVGKSSFLHCKQALTEKGTYLSPVLQLPLLIQMILTSNSKGKQAKFAATGMLPPSEFNQMLQDMMPLLEDGKISTLIGQKYDLDQIAEAHRYVDTGHKVGNVVISV